MQASGVTAVESAAARPDLTNSFRYASWISGSGGFTDAVSGADSTNPVQPPFAINNSVNSSVSNTDVASNTPSNNQFVVVWQESKTNVNTGITANNVYAQIYNNFVPIGSPIAMGGATAGNQTNCRVAMDSGGNFVVVWEGTAGGSTQVYAQRFSAGGAVRGATVQISGTATPNLAGNGVEPDVAMNSSGGYAITWVDNAQTLEQAFDAGGQAIGTTPNVVSGQTFTEPAIGIDNNGNVTVAWVNSTGGTSVIDFQQFDNTGLAMGGVQIASDNTSHNQNVPEIAVDTAGGFAIGWAEASSGSSYDSIAVRVFDRTATARDTEAVISGVTFGSDFRFGLAHRLANTFHVAYASGGAALMQTYADNSGGGGGEIPPAADSAFIDLTSTPAAIVDVYQTSSQFQVYINGVLTTYSRSTYHSIYVKGSVGSDRITMEPGVTVPTTNYGENGDDTIRGSAGVDFIDAGAGNDAVQGNDGDDYILGGDGNDTLFGGNGNERIVGGAGKNIIYGENGNDTLVGGTGNEAFYGGAGNDSVLAGGGGDYVDGGAGKDTIFGEDGNDDLYGNTGNDYIEGGAGADLMHGGRGHDSLYGGGGNDTLAGDANADFLQGGYGINYAYFDILDTLQHVDYRIQVI
ncbi:MAG: calcium-binding protein [Tepidisphaeraceae bacterium]